MFAWTDCSTDQSIRGQCSPDFLSVATTSFNWLPRWVGWIRGWAALLFSPSHNFCFKSAAKPLGKVQGSFLALTAQPLPHHGEGRATAAPHQPQASGAVQTFSDSVFSDSSSSWFCSDPDSSLLHSIKRCIETCWESSSMQFSTINHTGKVHLWNSSPP